MANLGFVLFAAALHVTEQVYEMIQLYTNIHSYRMSQVLQCSVERLPVQLASWRQEVGSGQKASAQAVGAAAGDGRVL